MNWSVAKDEILKLAVPAILAALFIKADKAIDIGTAIAERTASVEAKVEASSQRTDRMSAAMIRTQADLADQGKVNDDQNRHLAAIEIHVFGRVLKF